MSALDNAAAEASSMPSSSSAFEVDSELLWNKSVTGKTEAELQCLAGILRAGNPEIIPHIDKKLAKQLDQQLLNSGWQQPAHCQKIYKEKLRSGKWKQVDGTAEPTLCKHSLLLQYNDQHVLVRSSS